MKTKHNRAGRPRLLSPKQEVQARKYRKSGWMYREIAEYYGLATPMSAWFIVNRAR